MLYFFPVLLHFSLLFSPRLEVIDFGTQYTTQTHSKEFVIENRGRQPRKLVWNLESLEEKSETQAQSKPFLCRVSLFQNAIWVKQS